ncbi:hypothetical protein DIPPA_03780, partial [Diplonema papillatum]
MVGSNELDQDAAVLLQDLSQLLASDLITEDEFSRAKKRLGPRASAGTQAAQPRGGVSASHHASPYPSAGLQFPARAPPRLQSAGSQRRWPPQSVHPPAHYQQPDRPGHDRFSQAGRRTRKEGNRQRTPPRGDPWTQVGSAAFSAPVEARWGGVSGRAAGEQPHSERINQAAGPVRADSDDDDHQFWTRWLRSVSRGMRNQHRARLETSPASG